MKNFRYNSGATMVTGVILCVLGLGFWIGNYYPEFDLIALLNLGQNWPFFLVASGFYMIILQYNDYWKNKDEK
jgi:hypothetical protein